MLDKTVGGIATVLEGLEGSTELLELAEAEQDRARAWDELNAARDHVASLAADLEEERAKAAAAQANGADGGGNGIHAGAVLHSRASSQMR